MREQATHIDVESVKRWLRQARDIRADIDAKMARIDRLRSMAERQTSIWGEHVAATGYTDSRYDAVAELADAKNALAEQMHQLLAVYHKIETAIQHVPVPRLRALLEMRYLADMTWEAIAGKLHCDVRNTYRMHDEAIRRINIADIELSDVPGKESA